MLCRSAQAQAYANAAECNTNCGSTSSANNGRNPSGKPQPSNPAAEKYEEIQNKLILQQQVINSIGDSVLNVINSVHEQNKDSNDPDSDAPTNTRMEDSDSGSPAPEMSTSSENGDSTFDSDQPASSTVSAINALFAGSTQPDRPSGANGTAVANTVAGLLDSSKVSDSASAFPAGRTASASLPTPADPQFNRVLQESSDQADQDDKASLTQLLQSKGQQVQDQLSGLITSGKTLVSDLSGNPTVQWFTSQGWKGTTMRLPVATDTPETVSNLVEGQSVVGFGDILEGMADGPGAVAKGLYNYGSKMVNQMGAALGFADANLFGVEAQNQN